MVLGQNFQKGTKIFSTMFEKNGPGPRFSGKIAENFGPLTKLLRTKISVTELHSDTHGFKGRYDRYFNCYENSIKINVT